MTRRPDTPCAGGCGKLLWRSKTSAPNPVCRECRGYQAATSTHKRCNRCGETKPLDQFPRRSNRPSGAGRGPLCKPCNVERVLEYKRATGWRPKPRYEPRPCVDCGTPRLVRVGSRSQRCPSCAGRYGARARMLSDEERRLRRRRPKFTQAQRQAVFERDRWTCGICGGSVDPELAWPHPRCAVVDHVIPLSQGGFHEMANWQCAHNVCNVEKGAAEGQELCA